MRQCEKGGREGEGVRSCDIAAAARLRISVFSLRERERERERARRGEIGSVCGVLLC